MGRIEQVEDVLTGLSSPTSEDVAEATREFDVRDIAAVAAKTALEGGGGGSTPNLSEVLAEGADAGATAITNLADPTNDQDAATKKYVTDNAGGAAVVPGVTAPDGWNAAWLAALDQADSGLARIAVLGDSVARGYYSSVLDTNGWAGQLASILQDTYGDGGSGFISPTADLGIVNAVPTGYAAQMKVAKTGFSAGSIGAGVGIFGAIQSATPGDTLTFTDVRGTEVDIFYLSVGSAGSFTYEIDGGGTTTVNSDAANGYHKIAVTGLAPGTHTVVITVTIGGISVFIGGVGGRNASGVVVDNYSGQGGSSANLAGNLTYGGISAWSGGPSNPADLVIFAMGLNDDVGNGAADTYIGLLAAALSQIVEGSNDVSVLLLHNAAGPTWSAHNLMPIYSSRLHSFAAHFGCAVLDVQGRFQGSWQKAKDLDYWGDGTVAGTPGSDQAHPGDDGHLMLAQQIAALALGDPIPVL